MSTPRGVLFAITACTLSIAAGCGSPRQTEATPDPRIAAFAALPDWRGIWQQEGLEAGINGFPARVEGETFPPYKLAGFEAPWNDSGKKLFAAMLAGMGNRKSDGWGFPMMMAGAAPIQFVITPEETLVINQYREIRHVHTDGRPHPAPEDRWDTTWGHSIGKWEGDTLVIDTVSVRRPDVFFILAPPLSAEAHYIERIRRSGPGTLESEVTVEDPATLTTTWTARFNYVQLEGLDGLVHDAFTNDRSEVEDGVFSIEAPKRE